MNKNDFMATGSSSVLNKRTGRETHGQLMSAYDLPPEMATVMFNGDKTFGSNPHIDDPDSEPLPFMMKTLHGAHGYVRDRIHAHNVASMSLQDRPEDALEYITDMASKDSAALRSNKTRKSLIENILDQFFTQLKMNNDSRVYTISEAKFNALLHVLETLFESRSRKASGMYNFDNPDDFLKHDFYKSHKLVGYSERPEDYLLAGTPQVKMIDPRRDLPISAPIIGHLPGEDADVVSPHFSFDAPDE